MELPVLDGGLLDRRTFLGLVASITVLAACGDGTADSGSDTRLVDTALGEVAVPVDPKRVVGIYSTDLDVALALGLPVVGGGGEGGPEAGFARYQRGQELDGVTKLATYPELNFEQLAAVRPDCIIDSVSTDRDRFDQLTAIAPTLNYSDVPDWRAALRFVGAAFDRTEAAERAIAAYDEQVRAIRDRLGASAGGMSVAVVTPYDGELYVHASPDLFLDTILTQDLGFVFPDFASRLGEGGETEVVLAEENWTDIDSDWIVALVYSGADGNRDLALIEGVVESALWKAVPAVAADRVILVDAELNFASPLTAASFADLIGTSIGET
jgi:iron complex transport system substrate-binding protein